MCNLILDPKALDKYVCDGCQYFDKYKYGYNKNFVRKNCFCTHPTLTHRMVLAEEADPDTPCIMPPNCPMKDKRVEEINKPKWEDIKPITPWDDIKVQETYYIPPICGKKDRWTVEVSFKNDTYVSCKIISTTSKIDTYSKYKCFYRNSDKEVNFFVPKIM